ncbi:amidohydrolase family protein [Microvirga pudoricolor]|uniref:hypothetical protein n=1 Tax=Microvirga pudoricolor TaxID=2778729 RepID=UPI00194EE51B|nr:hypothetical protein [Microvirga pudoricolor]MBM6596300.1 hypothetical protein [Microvirga pudoricolor]
MPEHFDLIIHGGTVVTAADSVIYDVGVRNGKIATLGHNLGNADYKIDATGKIVMPGGIDSHVHIAQPSGDGVEMADDFESATRSAALGETTMVQTVLTHAHLRDGADYTPYEGMKITGWPIITLVRGVVVAAEGEVVGQIGYGSYISRKRSPHASRVAG